MNFVEKHTWNEISKLLNELDPEHKGWCVDAGIGDGDYYFEWFRNMGHPTIAIEPLPTDAAREAVIRSGALFEHAALATFDGEAKLYTSNNLHSLVEGLWGEVLSSKLVRTMTLGSVLLDVDHLSALKLDVEGAEGMVLRQLDPNKLPAIVCFEFGGMWTKASGTGSWTVERVKELQGNLQLVSSLGYTKAIIISSGDSDRIQKIELPVVDFDELFTPDTNWGNIIVWGIT